MPEDARTPVEKKSRRIPSMIAGIVAVLVVASAAGIYFSLSSARTPGTGARNTAFTLPLETFVVNLNGTERGYLRVGIALGLSRAPERKEEIPLALTRDTILSVLSAVKVQELAPPDGKTKLKNNILDALKSRAPQLAVEDVYFTEFLVQM
jgi:flagellar basal body-associated protein FliL